jgi:hypothetical protein
MSKNEKRGSRVSRNRDFLPTSVGDAFLKDLDSLVEKLAEGGGFKETYLLSEYKSKFLDSTVTSPAERRQAAIDKFMAVEERNRTTNMRLLLGGTDFGWVTSDELISKARQVILSILGDKPPLSLFDGGSHTFGASTRVRRGPQAAFLKHVGQAQVSDTAWKYWCLATSGTMLAEQQLSLQESSVLFTVPKSSHIDRVAAKEPEINMYLQRCAGSFIRSRLKRRAGIDLNDQTRNQLLAKNALRQDLATIDLSSASDSISRQLVIELLPFDWWSVLDDIRVHSTIVDGEVHTLEMFSSMGNGFTFELESLLFYALTRAICWCSRVKGTISVYGDDIIAPSKIGPRLARVFHWFGFRVNAKKSNWTGKFRESCGRHFYGQLEVTPFYVREPVRKMSEVIRLLNRLLYWDGREFGFFVSEVAMRFHTKWRQIVPQNLWGGQDPDRIDSLVTGHPPRSRLVWKPRSEQRLELGAYLYWFTISEKKMIQIQATGGELHLDPSRICGAIIAPQPAWLKRTSWTPDLIWS